MKHFLLTCAILVSLFITQHNLAYAARLVISAPEQASTNGEPFTVTVYIDTEGQKLSAISGALSFDSNLLTIDAITTRSSVVSLWVKQPKVEPDTQTEGTTTIAFEGIIPGGYDGVRSPYYKDKRPGIVFLASFRPKKEGDAVLSLGRTELHAFDKDGSILPTENQSVYVSIPNQSILYNEVSNAKQEVKSNTLDVSIKRTPLIANNAWYVEVNEDQSIRPTTGIFIVESNRFTPQEVKLDKWNQIDGIYVLQKQKRNKYIHIKVEYQNNTYTYATLAPVENFSYSLYSSRILLGIICALTIVLLYRYGSFIKNIFSKIFTKKSRKK